MGDEVSGGIPDGDEVTLLTEMVELTVRLPEDLLVASRDRSHAEDRSLASLVRVALRRYLRETENR